MPLLIPLFLFAVIFLFFYFGLISKGSGTLRSAGAFLVFVGFGAEFVFSMLSLVCSVFSLTFIPGSLFEFLSYFTVPVVAVGFLIEFLADHDVLAAVLAILCAVSALIPVLYKMLGMLGGIGYVGVTLLSTAYLLVFAAKILKKNAMVAAALGCAFLWPIFQSILVNVLHMRGIFSLIFSVIGIAVAAVPAVAALVDMQK